MRGGWGLRGEVERCTKRCVDRRVESYVDRCINSCTDRYIAPVYQTSPH